MFLVNSCLGLFTAACFPLRCLSSQVYQAPLLPKLRGHFAEFLSQSYPVGLKFLTLSTCVGLQYGHYFSSIEVFLGSAGSVTYVPRTLPHQVSHLNMRICLHVHAKPLERLFRQPSHIPPCVTPSLKRLQWYRNINLFSIRLRSSAYA